MIDHEFDCQLGNGSWSKKFEFNLMNSDAIDVQIEIRISSVDQK